MEFIEVVHPLERAAFWGSMAQAVVFPLWAAIASAVDRHRARRRGVT